MTQVLAFMLGMTLGGFIVGATVLAAVVVFSFGDDTEAR